MVSGLMWYDKDFNAQKAIDAHYKRTGIMPNVVYSRVEFECKLLTVKVIKGLSKNHYIVTYEEDVCNEK